MATTVRVVGLIRDLDWFPRGKLDRLHVRRLAEAVETGATLPPIRVWRGRNWVSDGWHRCAAVESLYGNEATIEADLVDYDDEIAFLEDAAGEASISKLPLSPNDQARLVVRFGELGVPVERVAGILNVRAEKLKRRVFIAPTAHAPGLGAIGRSIALKSDLSYLEGQTLSPAQVEANSKSGGMGVAFYARQIIMRANTDTINLTNTRVRRALRDLRDALIELPLGEIEEETSAAGENDKA